MLKCPYLCLGVEEPTWLLTHIEEYEQHSLSHIILWGAGNFIPPSSMALSFFQQHPIDNLVDSKPMKKATPSFQVESNTTLRGMIDRMYSLCSILINTV